MRASCVVMRLRIVNSFCFLERTYVISNPHVSSRDSFPPPPLAVYSQWRLWGCQLLLKVMLSTFPISDVRSCEIGARSVQNSNQILCTHMWPWCRLAQKVAWKSKLFPMKPAWNFLQIYSTLDEKLVTSNFNYPELKFIQSDLKRTVLLFDLKHDRFQT